VPSATEDPTFLLVTVIGDGVDDLLASLEAQTFRAYRVVLVDRGDAPRAAETARAWAQERPGVAQLLEAGPTVAAARNAALDLFSAPERGATWVSFPEAGDVLAPGYLADLAAAARRHPESTALVARQVRWDPARARLRPVPAYDGPHEDGRVRRVDLRSQPEDAPPSLRAAFVRLRDVGALRFDPRLEAGFQDQALTLRLLSAQAVPACAYTDARLTLRFQDDDPAGVREPFTHREKFTDILRYGHLETLAAFGGPGAAPELVQHAVLADLHWYFQADESLSGQMNAEMHHVADEFHDLMAQVLAQLSPQVLDSAGLDRLPDDRYVVVRYGYPGVPWRDESVLLDARDARQGLVRLSYRYTVRRPDEQVRLDGVPADARYAKTRTMVYAGRALAFERILWVSAAASVSIELDGVAVPVSPARAPRTQLRWSPRGMADAISGRTKDRGDAAPSLRQRLLAADVWKGFVLRRLAAAGPVVRRFKGSWVLMDRVESGHDNAEHLFAYLQAAEPGVRSWFAVQKNSKDWRRLKAQGHKNLLAYGSVKWALVCLNATHVISSQAGPYVYDPVSLRPVRKPSWRFVFLQHGVIATDLHRWLNRRKFDLFVTTTTDEYAAIAGEGSEYRFTPHEVALTGLPRHDRLFRMAAQRPREERRRILVLPTWREYLLGPMTGPDRVRGLREDFEQTLYARAWFGLLRSDALRSIAHEHGATIAFMPHPNVQPYLDRFDLPADVETLTYADNDIQEVITSAKVVVTDFSSIVFDAAYIGRPIVYYQFDQAEAFGGAHTVRQGYFSYEEDGFGPVVQDEAGAVKAVEEIARAGWEPSAEYAARMARTFPARDDGSSARVVEAIRGLGRRLSAQEARTAVVLPKAPANRPTPRVD
jgi:CDP-glycerol glycerophosphotransferase (TagB/SpsB family)